MSPKQARLERAFDEHESEKKLSISRRPFPDLEGLELLLDHAHLEIPQVPVAPVSEAKLVQNLLEQLVRVTDLVSATQVKGLRALTSVSTSFPHWSPPRQSKWNCSITIRFKQPGFRLSRKSTGGGKCGTGTPQAAPVQKIAFLGEIEFDLFLLLKACSAQGPGTLFTGEDAMLIRL
ncbi:MAG: hypothetical protein U0103_11535 [Candidatus Obscuribacterales bacterium]